MSDIPEYLFRFMFDNLYEMEVTFSPWMSDAIKDVIKLYVEKYVPKVNVVFKESKFQGKIR